jgi:hypothetical protein
MVASPGSRDDRMAGRAGLTPFTNLERVTRIELALSAWESVRYRLPQPLTCGVGCPRLAVRVRSSPRLIAR